MTPRIIITAGLACLIVLLGAQTMRARSVPAKEQAILAPEGLNVWLVGVHPMADNPERQMMAHHLCGQVEPELMQCALYESNLQGARLTGIEYIIPAERYEELPPEEKRLWHPHNFEILSGALAAPGAEDPMELLAGKMNSYGKTFHTWMAGEVTGGAESFPYGAPKLAWSLNERGQMAEEMRAAYRERGYDLDATREARAPHAEKAEPQCGVDALDGKFEGETTPIEGVVSREAGCPDAFIEKASR